MAFQESFDSSLGSQAAGGIGSIISSLLGSQSKSTTQDQKSNQTVKGTVTNFTPEQLDQLNTLIASLTAKATGTNPLDALYSKEAAVADSQGMVQALVNKLTTQDLPQLFNTEASTGAYNTTSKANLANDLTARTAQAGAEAQVQNIATYADILNKLKGGDIEALLNAFNVAKGGVQATDTTSKTDTTTKGVQGGTGIMGALFG